VALHHAPAGDPRVLDNAPVAMLFAILPANFAAQEHDDGATPSDLPITAPGT
jgi:hypothetical protein